MRRDGKLCLTGRKKPEGALLRLALSKNSAIFFFLSLGLERFGREKSGNAEIMQVPISVGILVDILEKKARLQLSAHLFLNGMGKLETRVVFHSFLIQHSVLQGIIRQPVFQPGFSVIKGEVYSVIQPGKKELETG